MVDKSLNIALEDANTIAEQLNHTKTNPYHILLALLKSNTSLSQMLQQQGMSYDKIEELAIQKAEASSPTLSEKSYLENMNSLAKEGKLKNII